MSGTDPVTQMTPSPLVRLVRDQRLAFVLVGMVNTAIGTVVFVAFNALTRGWGTYLTTLALAHVASVIPAYFLYRWLVFRVRGHVWLDFGRFEVVNLGVLAVNAMLLPFFLNVAHLQLIVAQIAVTAITASATYLGHKGFSFRRGPLLAESPRLPGGVPARVPPLVSAPASRSSQGPLVSIVVPAYNNAEYIDATMASILAQTYSPLEIIVADHTSDDGTWNLLQRYAGDPRLTLLRTPPGGGAKANWDRVSAAARGRWVKLVCGDDLIRPTAVAEQVEAALVNPGAVMIAARRDIVDAQGAPVLRNRGLAGLRGMIEGPEAVRATVRAGTNIFGEPACVLLRLDVLKEVGWWDDGDGENGYYIDAATYTRVLGHGDLVALGRTLASFRVNAGQWSVRLARQQAGQAAAFHASVHRRDPSMVSRRDVALGDARAASLALARRGTYFLLRRRMG